MKLNAFLDPDEADKAHFDGQTTAADFVAAIFDPLSTSSTFARKCCKVEAPFATKKGKGDGNWICTNTGETLPNLSSWRNWTKQKLCIAKESTKWDYKTLARAGLAALQLHFFLWRRCFSRQLFKIVFCDEMSSQDGGVSWNTKKNPRGAACPWLATAVLPTLVARSIQVHSAFAN